MIFADSEWNRQAGRLNAWQRMGAGVLNAYSGILFLDRPLIGALFLAASFWFPNVGLAGIFAAAVGMVLGYALRLPYATSGVNVYSSLLVGLSLGAYHTLDFRLVLLIALAAGLTVLLAAVLRDLLWRLGHLPVLSLPFVLVALTAALAASSYGGLTPYYPPSLLPPTVIGYGLDSFFTTLGSVFFSPHPMVGLLLFAGLLLRSVYLAFLGLAGFVCGAWVFTTLAIDPAPGLLEWTGFNFALTAMAVGGIFTVPSRSTFLLALAAAGAAAVVTGALSRLLLVYSLPVMALPFLLTTLTVLAALRLRVSATGPVLLLDQPDLPAVNFERARLARARLGSPDSVPLLAPFRGEWQVYQGFDGRHTHKNQWRYALDFYRLEGGQSFVGDGSKLEHYHCFGLPVMSPAYGLVSRVRDSLPDNAPGTLDLRNNWGNYVLIQIDSGLYVLLAHLRQASIRVKEGERVTPGTEIGRCGNSGRSPQPHLHLQVQRHAGLGGATVPFHLVSAILREEAGPARYRLVAEIGEDSSIERAVEDPGLAAALQLPVGRTLRYRLKHGEGAAQERTLGVEATLSGQLRLCAGQGASAAFEQRNGTLAFYDRQGPPDPLLDLWLLALGLTPLTTQAASWEDSPPARLLPLGWRARVGVALTHPLGAGIESHFERVWLSDVRSWQQRGRHHLAVAGARHEAATTAMLTAESGCTEIALEYRGRRIEAELVAVGQIADRGVPAWEQGLAEAGAIRKLNEDLSP